MTAGATIAKRTVEWSISISVVMIVVGILGIAIPGLAGRAVMALTGMLLIYAGTAHLAFGWEMRTTGALLWELLLGILYIFVGAYLMFHLAGALLAVTVVLGIYLILEAILEFILSHRLGPLPGSRWLAFDGIVTMMLAILVLKTWSAPWVIGVLVGISMLFTGISRLVLSLAARRVFTGLT